MFASSFGLSVIPACDKNTPLARTFALQSFSRNCSPAPDLVLRMPICPGALTLRRSNYFLSLAATAFSLRASRRADRGPMKKTRCCECRTGSLPSPRWRGSAVRSNVDLYILELASYKLRSLGSNFLGSCLYVGGEFARDFTP